MRICCVPFCHQKNRGDLTRSFHEFPCKLDLREKWIRIVSRLDPVTKELWQPKDKSVVCSKHFLTTDFSLSTKKRSLKPNAVPTIFAEYPSYMQRAVQKLVQTRKGPAKRLPLPPSMPKKPKIEKENFSDGQSPTTNNLCKITPTRNARFKDASVQISPSVPNVDRAIQVCSLGHSPHALKESRKKVGRVQRLNSRLRKQVEQLKMRVSFLEKKTELHSRYPIRKITKSAKSGSIHAQFLLEQLQMYSKNRKQVRYSTKTLECCHTWNQYCSSRSYEYVRRIGLLELPSRHTLLRHKLAIDTAKEAATKQQEEASAALIDETIESVVRGSCDETVSSSTELEDALNKIDGEIVSDVINIKPMFHDFAPGQVYYLTNALVENSDNRLLSNNIKREMDDQNQTALQPTMLQVFANDHCYYGTIPTTNCQTDPVSTQLASHSLLLEQISTAEVE